MLNVFLSIGLLDILRKKEIEAVLLHELHHVASGSSTFKLSTALLRLSPFSVLRNFAPDLGEDERAADAFVRQVQRTDRHLEAARRKIEAYAALSRERAE